MLLYMCYLELIKIFVHHSKKEGVKNSRPAVPPPPGPTPLVPSASLEAEDDMGMKKRDAEHDFIPLSVCVFASDKVSIYC